MMLKQWPQNLAVDEKSSGLTTEKLQLQPQSLNHPQQQIQAPPPPALPQPQPQLQALKCPRCDSSNTKFCYYNNYSLSQPRHFCKACKRYWTRGGTLRNVPVGGGCRKNKRVKRSSSSSSISAAEGGSSSITNPNTSATNSTSNPHLINRLFYGLPSNPSELNLPSFNSRIDTVSGYDALGFSSGKQIQDVVTSSNSMLSDYSIFGSSLLASSLHHHHHQLQQEKNNFSMKDSNFQQSAALTPFEDLHLNGKNSNSTESGSGICLNHNNNQNQMDQIVFSSLDPSLYWNPNSSSTTVGAIWHDPANIGSSVTSLI